MGLTPAQERVYRFVRGYIDQHGYAPSYEEIRTNLGFQSLNAVFKHLKQIEERGYLKIPWKNKKRAVELVPLQTGSGSDSISRSRGGGNSHRGRRDSLNPLKCRRISLAMEVILPCVSKGIP